MKTDKCLPNMKLIPTRIDKETVITLAVCLDEILFASIKIKLEVLERPYRSTGLIFL